MSRVQGHLITMTSCLLALEAFFFLPYLTISTADGSLVTFTGWQLLTPGSQILISAHAFLQRVPNLWVIPVLSVLVFLAASVAFWQDRTFPREDRPLQGCAPTIVLALGLMLFLFLCSCTGVAGLGWPGYNMSRNAPISVTVSWGYVGFLVFMGIAFLSSVIAWRAKK